MPELEVSCLVNRSWDHAEKKYTGEESLQDSNTPADFKITYPDGTSHAFKAAVSVKMDAGSVNGAFTFSCTMNVMSEIEITDHTV